MKKARPTKTRSTMRAHYDFSGGVVGKYADRVPALAVMAVLAPDVAKHFRSSAAVNSALRAVVKQRAKKKKKRPR